MHEQTKLPLQNRRGWLPQLLAVTSVFFFAVTVLAQSSLVNRIARPIQAEHMRVMPGTVHPLAQATKDDGPLDESMTIHGMSLVFRRSVAQQKDLMHLLQEQQTKGNAAYHQWLTPQQFAARYGMTQHDLGGAAAWLRSQGFTIDQIPASMDRIDFSGTVTQVNAAFHTQMRRYRWYGQDAWANSTALSLPETLADVAIGVQNLNTFRPRPRMQTRPAHVTRDARGLLRPAYTVQTTNGALNLIAPADTAVLYNVQALYGASVSGTGQYLGVAGQTDIVGGADNNGYSNLMDIQIFRSLSGLNSTNLPTQVLVPNSGTLQVSPGDLGEADLDVEWSGAVAKDATIVFTTVGSSQNFGVFNSLTYMVQNTIGTLLGNSNTKVLPVMSVSYGNCEQAYVTTDILTLEQLFQQANAQGQTVIASAGDSGSADCDYGPDANGNPAPAALGLQVDYPGSSVYVTAAGGTSFSGDISNPTQYWNSTNSTANGSVLSYISESAWNDTPTLSGLANNGRLSAGGGGMSSLFPKPSWQAAPGVPNDNVRDVPDVSLAADPDHDGYVLCTEETNSSGQLSGVQSCVPNPNGTTTVAYFDANGSGSVYGGTSIVAPQLNGLITLWNQSKGYATGVGNANTIFYSLATSAPTAFHDVTTGSNAVTCAQGTLNCIADPNNAGNFVESGYNTGSGYDLATGLGSVDAGAMATAWSSATTGGTLTATTTTLVPTPTTEIGGQPITLTATVTSGSTNTPVTSGTVSFTVFTQPLLTAPVNASGVASVTTQLPVGIDAVTATYATQNGFSASSDIVQVTVTATAPVATTTTVTATPTTSVVQQKVQLTATVTGGGGPVTSGNVEFTSGTGTSQIAIALAALNASGVATVSTTALPSGTDTLTAYYLGAGNDSASQGTVAVTVGTATGSLTLGAAPGTVTVAAGTPGTATITATPSGTVSGSYVFSCSGLPAYSSCTFNPAALTFSASSAAQKTVVTIATNVATAKLEKPRPFGTSWPIEPVLAGIFGFALLGVRRKGRRVFGNWMAVLLLMAGLALSTGLIACGGSSSGSSANTTPAGTSTITVTGTSSAGTVTTSFQFTVQ